MGTGTMVRAAAEEEMPTWGPRAVKASLLSSWRRSNAIAAAADEILFMVIILEVLDSMDWILLWLWRLRRIYSIARQLLLF